MAVALEQAPSTDNIAQENDSVKRYSERETRRNERYLSAIENGSTDYAAHLVEQAARDAGYTTPKLYHGTKRFGFTQFKGDFFYATTKPEVAGNYGGENYAGVRPVN